MKSITLLVIIFFYIHQSNEIDGYLGKYELCVFSNPKRWGTGITLKEENKFIFETTFSDWHSESSIVSGTYKIDGNKIEFHPIEATFYTAYSKESNHIDFYLEENNSKNRRKKKRQNNKNWRMGWKIEFHDFGKRKEDFYDEKWNYLKPVYQIYQDTNGIEFIPMDSISVLTNFQVADKYCKHKKE